MSDPTCVCGKTMTRENSTLRPEFFLCDECCAKLFPEEAMEPQIPEAVKDLLWDGTNDLEDESNRRVVEAYRRGRAG